MLRVILSAALATVLLSASAQAQGRNTDDVPPGHRPPAGMCRIWIDAVPPGQQAAPTDCATAVRNRPANGRVLFGDENAKPGKGSRSFEPKRLRDGDVKKSDEPSVKKADDRDNLRKAKSKKSGEKTKDAKKKPNPNDI